MRALYWNGKKKKDRVAEEQQLLQEEIMMMNNPPQLMDNAPTGVELDENKIYFYCSVGDREVLDLNKNLRKLDLEMQYLGMRLNIPTPPIELRIQSEGGNLFAGLAAYDCIKSCKSPVHTYIDGNAASAASLLFLAGSKRHVSRNSFLLIHQLSATLLGGKYEEFKDELKNQEKLMHNVKNIYLQSCKLTEQEIEELMKHDLWMDAEQVLQNGFADLIV